MKRLRSTWFATPICLAASIIPGTGPIGTVAVAAYRYIFFRSVGVDADFIVMREIYRFGMPGLFAKWLAYELLPALMQGFIAGAIAIWLTQLVCDARSSRAAGNWTAGLYFAFSLIEAPVVMSVTGLTPQLVGGALQQIAVICALLVLRPRLQSDDVRLQESTDSALRRFGFDQARVHESR